jgi:hypothetical protein
MSRAAKALLVAAILVAGESAVQALCVRHIDGPWCGVQCTWFSSGVYCFAQSNVDRACWDSGTGGACGEEAHSEYCLGCAGVGSF